MVTKEVISGKKAAEVIMQVMADEGINKTELAGRMGCIRQNVSQMLNRGTVNMRYDSFFRMVNALGYEIVIRKKLENPHLDKDKYIHNQITNINTMEKTKKRALKKYEKEMLEGGNIYNFAHLVLEFHEDICKEAGFDFSEAVNNYRARTDFNNGIYTLFGNNYIKYLFDTEMNFRGTKC